MFYKIAFPLFMSLVALVPMMMVSQLTGLPVGQLTSWSVVLIVSTFIMGLVAHTRSNLWVTEHPGTEFGKGVLGGEKGKVTGQPLLPPIIYPHQQSFYPRASYAYGHLTRKEFE
ncbi:MAG: hypothetical protein HYS07_11475, partial [Chlamydiae bacterium]|nr:hypothetical protein [Chlamydiota bacterium]MBI3278107.1 hypothetical protein [Chlamydiota bacterium]